MFSIDKTIDSLLDVQKEEAWEGDPYVKMIDTDWGVLAKKMDWGGSILYCIGQ